jgi:hypothetical protein
MLKLYVGFATSVISSKPLLVKVEVVVRVKARVVKVGDAGTLRQHELTSSRYRYQPTADLHVTLHVTNMDTHNIFDMLGLVTTTICLASNPQFKRYRLWQTVPCRSCSHHEAFQPTCVAWLWCSIVVDCSSATTCHRLPQSCLPFNNRLVTLSFSMM